MTSEQKQQFLDIVETYQDKRGVTHIQAPEIGHLCTVFGIKRQALYAWIRILINDERLCKVSRTQYRIIR